MLLEYRRNVGERLLGKILEQGVVDIDDDLAQNAALPFAQRNTKEAHRGFDGTFDGLEDLEQ